jgi:hypothetical protein
MVALNTYSGARLVHLLRLLRPVPAGWVPKAQRTILDLIAADRASAHEKPVTQTELRELTRLLELDSEFRQSFDADPIAAAEAAGWPELARALEREMRELVALAERVARDDAYRAVLNADPIRTLETSGVPSAAAEPLMRAVATADELDASLPDVVAHQHVQEPPRTQLLLVLLSSTEVRKRLRHIAGGL